MKYHTINFKHEIKGERKGGGLGLKKKP